MATYKEEMMTEGLGHPLFVREWLPEGDIRGLVQLCHGMAEHSARYAKLGEYLASYGYAAFCHDHRGHGKTCREGEVLGYFGETGGWDALVNDAVALGADIPTDRIYFSATAWVLLSCRQWRLLDARPSMTPLSSAALLRPILSPR